MTSVDLGLLAGLLLAALLAHRDQRALFWLGAAALSYIVSVMYWRLGGPHAAFIAGLCDAAVCLAIYFFARYWWEMRVWNLFQISMAINFAYLGGEMGLWNSLPHNTYSIMLESVNWLALLWIGGNGAMQTLGAFNDAHASERAWRRLLRPLAALHRERTPPAFHKVGR